MIATEQGLLGIAGNPGAKPQQYSRNEFQPLKEFTITDLETLKVAADPLRTQILEALILQAMTVKQVAEKLGLAPSKLYYHFNLLEKHNLIQVASTRVVSGIIEKQYRAAAVDYEVDRSLLSFTTDAGKETINTLLSNTLDATREDMQRSLQARYFELDRGAEERPRRVVLGRQISRVSEARAGEFLKRLEAVLKEFGAADIAAPHPDDPVQTYALTIAFYPSFYCPAGGTIAATDESAPEG